MALDAFVHCDCFETNNLRCDPPAGVVIKPERNGDLGCEAADDQAWAAFLAWKRNRACFHYGMILMRHRLGSSEQIDGLRTELEQKSELFPVLLKEVLYSGTHTCDWIPCARIPQLSEEVQRLAPELAPPGLADSLQLLKIRMAELIIAAQHAKKPICF